MIFTIASGLLCLTDKIRIVAIHRVEGRHTFPVSQEVLSARLNLDLESVSTPPSFLLISKHPFGIEKRSANE
jgi:hypothetical protein